MTNQHISNNNPQYCVSCHRTKSSLHPSSTSLHAGAAPRRRGPVALETSSANLLLATVRAASYQYFLGIEVASSLYKQVLTIQITSTTIFLHQAQVLSHATSSSCRIDTHNLFAKHFTGTKNMTYKKIRQLTTVGQSWNIKVRVIRICELLIL